MQSVFKNSIALSAGFEYEIITLRPVVGDLLPDKESTPFYNGYLLMNLDRYDDVNYPSIGSRFCGLYKLVNTPDSRPVHFFSFRYEKAVRIFNRFTLLPSIFGGFSSADTANSVYQFYVGGMNQLYNKGLVSFVGLDFMQVTNRVVTGIGLNFQYNFWKNNYIVLKANAGSTAWTIANMFNKDSGLLGFGITLGNNSVIGPIEITLMASNAHRDLLSYINIGYWF
jgi:NTE family protein